MEKRRLILFKLDGEIILEERCNLYLNQIDELKYNVAMELGCEVDDIEVETIDIPIEMSDEVDVSSIGLIFWKDTYFMPIIGVMCELEIDSDAYMDAVANGTIENYLHFYKE